MNQDPAPGDRGVPPGIEAQLRRHGTAIDPAAMRALYAPLLARQPRDGLWRVLDLAYGEHLRQRLDVYRPAAAGAARPPIVVFVHGGGFVRGDKSERENIGFALARAGFVAVLPNYRLAPAQRWPAGAEDMAEVCRWLARHPEAHGGDPGRLVLAGESAGAAHVATAALRSPFLAADAARIKGLVLISGTYNPRLENLAARALGMAEPDTRNLAHFGPDPSSWGAMSLVERIDARPFPVLISYAERDPPQFQVGAGELFARLVCQHGFRPDLHVVRGHNHLSQLYAVGTGDESLWGPVRAFLLATLG